MTTAPELGRLERADPQLVWPHEAHDFTPWLFANGDRLADALGIELELDATEHPVGGYRLDIIGRDLTNGADLMIENQFGVTDHGHLGQVLTYAAGTGAQTVVWIARRFRDEHRQALDWLNEQSDQKTHFFGIEVCVGRIGDSAWLRCSRSSFSRTSGRRSSASLGLSKAAAQSSRTSGRDS